MGFLDKAKAAASDLAAKADTALNSGGPDPATLYRDLGRMTYDGHAGRPVDADAKARILAELAALDQQGRLAPQQAPPGPPPPPGAAAAADAAPPPAPQEDSPQPDPGEGRAAPPPPPPPSGWPST